MHSDDQFEIEPLSSGFLKSMTNFGARPAVEVERRSWSYNELHDLAARISATLVKYDAESKVPLTGVFAYRSIAAYAGVLAALFRNHGYVPLNRTFPVERTKSMLLRAGCSSLIIDEESATQLEQVLQGISNRLTLVFPTLDDVRSIADRWPQHTVIGARGLEKDFAVKASAPRDLPAYLLFTSGSTGMPKGVLLAQRNVRHYVSHIVDRYNITHTDRCSQTFDMTFDLSAHDMFVTWERGACLCCPSQKALINPGAFIVDSRITTWFSVPSTAVFMKKLGALKANRYPGLRLSLFCGEALPADLVRDWTLAAPNSVVENIYGPTELTIACTGYRWDSVNSPKECELGLTPIGEPFPGLSAIIVDEHLKEVPTGETGELLVCGPQVSLGYWQDEAKTRNAFVTPPGQSATFYRTGDRVRRAGPGKPIVYLGRMDNQVKILGHRVELGEIEAVVREASGVDAVIAVGWPQTDSGASGVEVFLQATGPEPVDLKPKVEQRLPTYMVPRRFHYVPTFPVNSNGKFDRSALVKLLSSN